LLPFAEAIAHCAELMYSILETIAFGLAWLFVVLIVIAWFLGVYIILDLLVHLVMHWLIGMRRGQIRLESEEETDRAVVTGTDI
jgi:hypothetical protein